MSYINPIEHCQQKTCIPPLFLTAIQELDEEQGQALIAWFDFGTSAPNPPRPLPGVTPETRRSLTVDKAIIYGV
jgi:hypothetical protein